MEMIVVGFQQERKVESARTCLKEKEGGVVLVQAVL